MVKVIDMASYPRREHFEHFQTMGNPFVSLTKQIDITSWLAKIKGKNYPFFLSFQYAVVQAANSVPELRQRIRDGGIVEYTFCNPSYTLDCGDGTYRYCNVNADQPFGAYLQHAADMQRHVMDDPRLVEADDPESMLFISCVPWLSYTALEMPKPAPSFSVPSITWGKYEKELTLRIADGQLREYEKYVIPVTIMVNHSIVDGRHIAAFFSALEKELSLDYPAADSMQ